MRIIIVILIFIPLLSFPQKRGDNWCVADSILLTFNQSSITVGSSVLRATSGLANYPLECMATISDDSGKLLFYTDGTTVWNTKNRMMLNGDSLKGSYTITDGVLIIPYPEHDSLYYIFYLGYPTYSVVNMNLDSGFGAIVKKNIQLQKSILLPLTEKLSAVKHANGKDWWLIGDTLIGNSFYKFLITSDSIYGPYWQSIGLNQGNWGPGEICFSLDGNKLGMVNARAAEVFDFNRCTGELSNDLVLDSVPLSNPNNFPGYYGCSFSPDASKFYASTIKEPTVSSDLYQFNLSSSKPSSTKTLIWHDLNFNSGASIDSLYVIGQHELAPNGKIYITITYENWPNTKYFSYQNKNLCVINNPDSLGLACDFQPYFLYLNGHRATYGLPNMPNYNLTPLESAGTITASNNSICVGSGVTSLLNTDSTVGALQWQSSMDSIHFSSLSGDTLNSYTTPPSLTQTTYYRLVAGSGSCIDSSNVVAVHIVPLPVANFKDSISGQEVFFTPDSLSVGITSYNWDFGDSSSSTLQNPSHTYKQADTFTVCLTVYNGSNCSYTVCKNVNLTITRIDEISPQSLIEIYPNPAQDELTIELSSGYAPKQIIITDALGRTLLQITSDKPNTQMNIQSLSAGIYFVKVQMNDGGLQVRKFVKE